MRTVVRAQWRSQEYPFLTSIRPFLSKDRRITNKWNSPFPEVPTTTVHTRIFGFVMIAWHHISRVMQLCDRALILHQGKLTFAEPRQQPWDSFHRAFSEFLPRGPS